jgi:hypothetical protein
MKTTDVRVMLQLLEVPTDYYDVGVRDGAICLFGEQDEFVVCTFDRGKRFNERRFDVEDDACRYFLRQLIEDKWNFFPARLI